MTVSPSHEPYLFLMAYCCETKGINSSSINNVWEMGNFDISID